MSNFNCSCRPSCTAFAIVASIIVGIITAFLQFAGAITITPAFLWVALGVAVLFLALLLVLSYGFRSVSIQSCVCAGLPTVLVGILGSALLSVVLLAFPPVAASILFALLAGVLLAFLALILTAVACFIKCAAGCGCGSDN
ncbi:MAG: hypothetical protein E7408_04615 [Ruminococcaceae bacterium]|nr:hypothetical protein [Oscillospiraceae bacterium]